jgi:cysteine desulfuration protein SufE
VTGSQTRTINEVQDEIIAELAAKADRLARYEYLIALGRRFTSMEKRLKTEENMIPGCLSTAWLVAEIADGRIRFAGDSESAITKGILHLLLRVLNGRPPEEAAAADLYFIERTGLRSNLSPARANGVAAIVERMRALCRNLAHSGLPG